MSVYTDLVRPFQWSHEIQTYKETAISSTIPLLMDIVGFFVSDFFTVIPSAIINIFLQIVWVMLYGEFLHGNWVKRCVCF